MQSLCGQQVPGNTHRDLQVRTAYAGRTFKHILVPVWLVNYTFGPKTFQVLVNGYTGSTAGDRPISWVKVFFYIVIPAILVLIIIALVNSQEG